MNALAKTVMDENSKFEEACRKLALELFNRRYQYLPGYLASKVRRIAANRLLTKEE